MSIAVGDLVISRDLKESGAPTTLQIIGVVTKIEVDPETLKKGQPGEVKYSVLSTSGVLFNNIIGRLELLKSDVLSNLK